MTAFVLSEIIAIIIWILGFYVASGVNGIKKAFLLGILFYSFLDCIGGPIIALFLDSEYNDPTLLRRQTVESYQLKSLGLFFLAYYYLLLYVFILSVKGLNKSVQNFGGSKAIKVSYTLWTSGMSINLVIITLLIISNGFFALISERSIYTSTLNEKSYFGYLLLFKEALLIGTIGIIIYERRRLFLILSIGLTLLIYTLYGGRTAILNVFVVFLFVRSEYYNLRVSSNIFKAGAVLIGLVTLVSVLRFGGEDVSLLKSVAYTVVDSFLSERRLVQTCMSLRDFPTEMNYFFGGTLLVGLKEMFIGLSSVEPIDMFDTITKHYSGVGRVQSAGGNYATVAEFIMNFGPLGTIVILPFYVLLYKILLDWMVRKRYILYLLYIYFFFILFFAGMDSKSILIIPRFFRGISFGMLMYSIVLISSNKASTLQWYSVVLLLLYVVNNYTIDLDVINFTLLLLIYVLTFRFFKISYEKHYNTN